MNNEHVYKYWRWRGWIKECNGNHWGAFFFRDFARQERATQAAHLLATRRDEPAYAAN